MEYDIKKKPSITIGDLTVGDCFKDDNYMYMVIGFGALHSIRSFTEDSVPVMNIETFECFSFKKDIVIEKYTAKLTLTQVFE